MRLDELERVYYKEEYERLRSRDMRFAKAIRVVTGHARHCTRNNYVARQLLNVLNIIADDLEKFDA